MNKIMLLGEVILFLLEKKYKYEIKKKSITKYVVLRIYRFLNN